MKSLFFLVLALCLTGAAFAEEIEDFPEEDMEMEDMEFEDPDEEDDLEEEDEEDEEDEDEPEEEEDEEEEDEEEDPHAYYPRRMYKKGPTLSELLDKVKQYLPIAANLASLELECTCKPKDDKKDKKIYYYVHSKHSYGYPTKKSLLIRRPSLDCDCLSTAKLLPLYDVILAELAARKKKGYTYSTPKY